MSRLIVSLIMALSLLFGSSALGAGTAASGTSQTSIDHKPGHHPHGKHKAKGHYKKGDPHRSYTIAEQPVLSPKDDHGKHKGSKNCGKGKRKCKKGTRTNTGQGIFSPFGPGNGANKPGGQKPDRCVIIERPTEEKIVYRTKTETKTHRILFGAGLFALAMVAAGLLALFLGYILGWRGAGKNEEKFLDGILHDK